MFGLRRKNQNIELKRGYNTNNNWSGQDAEQEILLEKNVYKNR